MKVKLLRPTAVRFPANTQLEVTGEEGKRLIAFGLAEEIKETPKASKPKKKKKGEE